LDQTLREVLADDAALDIERVVEAGDPATVLLRRSEGADLLVVGSRGHGGFSRLLVGSVSEKCVRYATCSVVVVRPGA
jgi:nucleotide-binding universal stress UspA family protein